ncbi:MAG: MaoC family dehydratase N-terminal domain-containing protein [Pseudomonadales bacterium]
MNPEQRVELEEKAKAFVGRSIAGKHTASDAINMPMIRHWAEAVGDTNPAYSDPEWAKNSQRERIIAPPAMMYAWAQHGYPVAGTGRPFDGQSQLVELFDSYGFTGSLGVNVTQEYFADMYIGDTITEDAIIESVSEQKSTARGIGYFFQTLARFTNQNGELVGIQTFRVLKFIPQPAEAAAPAAAEDKLEVPTRIASPRGQDNGWWWEACDAGKVLIQRCKSCQTLRHPPRPMCGECQSTEWDSIESTLDGEVFSFVEMHYPKFPGYQYPLIVAVIDLAEGTRIVANVVGCDAADVKIGMKLKGKVEQVDEKTMLPQFYPA